MGFFIAMLPVIIAMMAITLIKLGLKTSLKLWLVWIVTGFISFHWVAFCLDTF